MSMLTRKDLEMERWLRRREEGILCWTTKDGKRIPLKDMSDSHIEHALALLEKEMLVSENQGILE